MARRRHRKVRGHRGTTSSPNNRGPRRENAQSSGKEAAACERLVTNHDGRNEVMASVLVIDDRDAIAALLIRCLGASAWVTACRRAPQLEDGFGGELSQGYLSLFSD